MATNCRCLTNVKRLQQVTIICRQTLVDSRKFDVPDVCMSLPLLASLVTSSCNAFVACDGVWITIVARHSLHACVAQWALSRQERVTVACGWLPNCPSHFHPWRVNKVPPMKPCCFLVYNLQLFLIIRCNSLSSKHKEIIEREIDFCP